MQQSVETKRLAILEAAAKLFANRPFHEVRLDDVATAAHVGKGTVYLYFKNKDDLFASLVFDGYARLVEKLQTLQADKSRPAFERLRVVVDELVRFAKNYPHFYSLMRDTPHAAATLEMRKARESLGHLAGKIIKDGVRKGELIDPHPEVTGQFVPACVRSAIVFGSTALEREVIVEHVMRIIGQGIERK